jgi:nicotinate-nucleotide adenylyltransferase
LRPPRRRGSPRWGAKAARRDIVEDRFARLDRDKTVVVFGGTFDPPHIGHLVVADDVFYDLRPSAVLFVVAATPPHKTGEPHTPAETRLHMVKLAVAGDRRFLPSALELERGGVSYTVDTVRALKEKGFSNIAVAVGADNLVDIPTWKDWRRLREEVRLVALTRPGFDLTSAPAELAGTFETLAVTPVPISSTLVRERVRAGRPFRYLVPPAVFDFILAAKLYR